MNEYFFLLSSITSALKGEEILRKNGFRANVFRDKNFNPFGCGYVIKVYGDKNKAEAVLKKSGVKINEIKESR